MTTSVPAAEKTGRKRLPGLAKVPDWHKLGGQRRAVNWQKLPKAHVVRKAIAALEAKQRLTSADKAILDEFVNQYAGALKRLQGGDSKPFAWPYVGTKAVGAGHSFHPFHIQKRRRHLVRSGVLRIEQPAPMGTDRHGGLWWGGKVKPKGRPGRGAAHEMGFGPVLAAEIARQEALDRPLPRRASKGKPRPTSVADDRPPQPARDLVAELRSGDPIAEVLSGDRTPTPLQPDPPRAEAETAPEEPRMSGSEIVRGLDQRDALAALERMRSRARAAPERPPPDP